MPSASDQPHVASRGVWFSEIAYLHWIAGDLGSARRVKLRTETFPLTGGSGVVVTGVRSTDETSIAVVSLVTGRSLVETTVPFNVEGAAVAPDGATVYLAGVAGTRTLTDAGVVALTVGSGSIVQVLEPAPLRPEWQGDAARGALAISPDGTTLASTLCGAPAGNADSTCDIQVVDLASRTVVGGARTTSSYLEALTDDAIVTRNQTSVVAFDFTGRERWRFDAAEIRGPIAATHDGVIVAYAATGTVVPTRIGKLAAESGVIRDLIVGEGDDELSVWSTLSDASTVFVAEGPPMELAFEGGTGSVVVSTIDAASSQVVRNALRISPEG